MSTKVIKRKYKHRKGTQISTKKCTCCQKVKRMVYFIRNIHSADGYTEECILCQPIAYKPETEPSEILNSRTKVCINCKFSKPFSCFGTNNATRDGKHRYCKECANWKRRIKQAKRKCLTVDIVKTTSRIERYHQTIHEENNPSPVIKFPIKIDIQPIPFLPLWLEIKKIV